MTRWILRAQAPNPPAILMKELTSSPKQTDFQTSFKTRIEKLCYYDHEYVNGMTQVQIK